ncbi:helix-turn-helix transcriptional regulator [uncultured Aquimarina sp.]|uniref:helix-turn-helix domain-containing protein n=1 Tax=uncultured Aquimarina sp. TaxID=575652 RepID=UPI00262F3753|nr:helix-turn-helix transcriptional regulator [uncultured Aquimarina sp.]
MVNTTAFGKRIQEIMKFYHVSASGFADAMGVGRSSISHILSGRNKPSLDFVMKITEAYPEAELYWLLYGQGTFPKSEVVHQPKETPPPVTPVTPTPIETPDVTESEQDLFSLPEPDVQNNISDISNKAEKQIINSISSNKEINQIVFFYMDGTFDIYKN